ncbi:MAG: D-3-phosphoglycerate dehydrogenase [Myxococcota bacterium]
MPRVSAQPFSNALIVEGPHLNLDDHLRAVGIVPHRIDKVPDESALIDAIRRTNAEVLFKRSRVPVTAEVLAACASLHAVQLCCIGDDSVDTEAAASHGVMVFNDPVSNGRSVVELAVAHLIAMARRLYETDVAAHDNRWEKNATGRYEVAGKRLGIIGLGNIGRQVARVCAALGMEIAFFDSRPVAVEVGIEMGWTSCPDLDTLFRSCDMASVHTSAKDFWGKDNDGFLDPYLPILGADRDDNGPRLFLNLARGNVHSVEALKDAIASGRVRRAAVDVYPSEPRPGAAWINPYADEPRVICTPHIGAATQEAQPRIARRVATTIGEFSRFGSVRDCVFAPRAALSLKDNARGKTLLAVTHSTVRGTKKAVDDAIYSAEANNLGSTHRDFDIGVAYDLSLLDRPLTDAELENLFANADDLSQDIKAVRSVRQIQVPEGGW